MHTERQGNPWAALAALCLGFFMIMLDTSILNVAAPALLTKLGASLNQVVWVTSAYALAWAVPMLLSGRLGDRFGRRRIFLIGMVVFTAASVWCGLSGSPEMLITARVLQGAGAALITPQTLAFVTHLFPPQRRGTAMGMWSAVAGLATIVGPLAGGFLVQTLGWQWIFYVNVPFGILGIILTLVYVPIWKTARRHSFDPLGIALSGVGLFLVIFGVQNGEKYHWRTVSGALTVTELLVAGTVLLIAFVGWQRYNKSEPLVPLTLFRSRNFSLGNISAVMIGICLTGALLPLMLYFQNVLRLSPLEAGLLLAPSSLVSGLVAPFAGKLTDRVNGKYIAAFGFSATAVGVAILAGTAHPDSPPLSLLPGVLLMGLGIGCVFSPLSSLTMNSVDPAQIGAGSGVYNTFRQVGNVLGSALVGVLLQARLAETVPGGAPDSSPVFRTGFTSAATGTLWLPVGALLAGAVACFFFRGKPLQAVDAAQTPTTRSPASAVG